MSSLGTVYVADTYNVKLRAVTSGIVTTFAGCAGGCGPGSTDGAASSASFNYPMGIAVSSLGTVYVADTNSNKLRAVTNGIVTTFAGCAGTCSSGSTDGAASSASFNYPMGIAVSSEGTTVYVADTNNRKLRAVANGIVTTFAGCAGGCGSGSTDGVAAIASFGTPYSVAVSSLGTVYVTDTDYNKLRAVTNGIVTTFAGCAGGQCAAGSTDEVASSASFNSPWGIAVSSNSTVYVSEVNNYKLRVIVPSAAGAVCTSNASCASGICKTGACCSYAAARFGCAGCELQSGSCLTFSPGEACAISPDCASNMCLGGCCCSASAILTAGCTACTCWSNTTTTAATAGSCSSTAVSSASPFVCNASSTVGVNATSLAQLVTFPAAYNTSAATPLLVLSSASPLNSAGVDIVIATAIACTVWNQLNTAIVCDVRAQTGWKSLDTYC